MNKHYWNRYIKFIEWAEARPLFPGYAEWHHIIPKSLGGSDKKNNLIRLDSREHFIAHWLLVKALPSKEMRGAFYAMSACSSKKKILTSKEYSIVRSFKQTNTEKFIERAKQIHGTKYDYSISIYKGIDNKFKYICSKHGVIEQTPYSHINKKHGCRFCGYLNKIPARNNYNTKIFIEKAKNMWGDLYDYSLVEYTNSQTPVKIICKEHGVFLKRPDKHIQKKKQGCVKCGNRNSGLKN